MTFISFKRLSFWILGAASAIGFSACGSFREEKPQPARFAQLEVGQAPGYNRVRALVFESKCLGCHSAAGGNKGQVNLETYASAVTFLDRVDNEVAIEKVMPPSGPLNADDQSLVHAWVQAGGLEQDGAVPR